ncbi:MAG: carboxypeptidase regulatory-like domain-containing protein [Planctomycetes bacterium]|nr:carboxypeptidase regulatory-like domain-containing protein [Planctomycetota bacterium]
MRALFLAALALALVGVGAWLVFSPAPGESAPRALAESASSGASDAERALEAGVSTARAESLPASADDPEIEASASGADSPTCAELFRPGDLWVRWLDREGRPAPAPRARLEGSDPAEKLFVDPSRTQGSEQLWRIAPEDLVGQRLREQRLRLHILDLFPRTAYVGFAYEPPRRTPHELRLPPQGELVVVLQDGGLALPPELSFEVIVCDHLQARSHASKLKGRLGEELCFSRLALGVDLMIRAEGFREQVVGMQLVLGPGFDGERRRAVLTFPAGAPVLTGQIRDDLGTPLAEQRLFATLRDSQNERKATLVTTKDGRFLWTILPVFGGNPPWRATLELSTRAGLKARVRELEIPAAEIVNLGTLELHARAAGLAGRVVERNGAPVANAQVEIEVLAQPGASKSRLRTDEHGRFAWEDPRGNDSSNQLLVSAMKGFSASGLRTFPGGTNAIELVLEETGEIHGCALLPPGPISPIALQLRGIAPGAPAAIDRERTRLNVKGRFQWSHLAPGRYELEVAFASLVPNQAPVPLLTLRDLVVPAGGPCTDPRLDPIDLRAHLSTFTFELRNAPADRTLAKDDFWYRRCELLDTPWTVLHPPAEEALSWTLPRGTYDFVFELDRCRRIELRGRTEGAVIELQPSYRARVTFENYEQDASSSAVAWYPVFTTESELPVQLEARRISPSIFELEPKMCGGVRIRAVAIGGIDEGPELPSKGSARIEIADTTELQEFRVQLR